MRPISVEFSAFGSYPDIVSVDFTTLATRGLFVVTGDTGTGKTTIFDAMSFALFGKMASKDSNDIRSHHAKPDAETWARFTFEIDGVRYTAERSPEYLRAKKTGAGTTKQSATALLNRVESNGSTTALATKTNDMNARIAELVGLTAEQFRRVIVLPQGEVSRFLLDDSGDREALLGALFGGEVYDRIARLLDAESKTLHDRVGATDESMRHHLANAIEQVRYLHQRLGAEAPDLADHPRDGLDDLIDLLKPAMTELESSASSAQERAREAARLRDGAATEATRFDDAAEARRAITAFNDQLPSATHAAESAEQSKRARPVVDADSRRSSALSKEADAKASLDTRLDDIRAAGAQSGVGLDDLAPAALATTLGDLNNQVTEGRAIIAAVSSANQKVEHAARDLSANETEQHETEARIGELTTRCSDLQSQLDALAGAPLDTSGIDEEHQVLSTVLSDLSHLGQLISEHATRNANELAANDKFEATLKRYVATEAPRLAERLEPGAPCVVCGATEHPAPAIADGGTMVTIDDVDTARSQRDRAQAERLEIERSLQSARTALGEFADADAADITDKLNRNRESKQVIEAAIQERRRLNDDLTTATDHLQSSRDSLNRVGGAHPGLVTAHADALVELDQAQAAAASVNPSELDNLETCCGRLRPLLNGLESLITDVTAATTERRAAERHLAEQLDNSGFDTVEMARALMLDEAIEHRALSALERLTHELDRAQTKLETLESQGVPAERPNTEMLDAMAKDAAQASQALAEEFTLARQSQQAATAALHDYDRLGDDSVDLRSRADAAKRASTVCRGQGSIRVSLRRWVLGRELERVTEIASVHLAQMTGGRYGLRRVEDVSGGRGARGLDLEVLDAHTGRPRRPNSLSGGEQFQASLALALGLADVVSQGGSGSGQRIEALFIDEGFGSLDPRALDDAIETLHDLHASGRMVGAITHVEAMKERLHPGIVVRRLPDGRGSTLSVNP